MTTIRTTCGECRLEHALTPDRVTLIRSGDVVSYGWGPCTGCGAHTVRTANSECLSLLASAGMKPVEYPIEQRPAGPVLTNADLIDFIIDMHTRIDPLTELVP